MPIYHDDVFTTGVDEGAHPGDPIKFTINGFEAVTNPVVLWTFTGDVIEVCDFSTCDLIIEPDSLWAYYKYAINPMTVSIFIGNLPLGHTVDDIDTSTIRVNETIVPLGMIYHDSMPDFDSRVLEVVCSMVDFLNSYALIWDSTYHTYIVTGGFYFKPNTFNKRCEVWLRGHISGDGDGDGNVTIMDVAYLRAYLYENGAPLRRGEESIDVGHSNSVNLLDIAYLLKYLYLNGPPPFCPQTNY